MPVVGRGGAGPVVPSFPQRRWAKLGLAGNGPGCLCLQEQQKTWAVNLNGFDVEEAKILRLSGKPQNAPEGRHGASEAGAEGTVTY